MNHYNYLFKGKKRQGQQGSLLNTDLYQMSNQKK